MARTVRGVEMILLVAFLVLAGLGTAQAAGTSVPRGQQQDPAYMVLEGAFEGGMSSSSACSICLPPATSGTLRLEIDWRSGSVSGRLEGTGAGSMTAQVCEGEEGETFSGSGSETVEGAISGSMADGSLSLTGQLHYIGSTVCTDNCENTLVGGDYDYVDEVPISGTVTRDGIAQGTFSWVDAPCSYSASWSAEAVSIQYDSDNDGLLDEEDRCPTLASDLADGCPEVIPDSDGDGLTDEVDSCPQQASFTQDGCPPPILDTDGDGIPEEEDACPGRAADTPDGCPEEQESEQDIAQGIAEALILGGDLSALEGWSELSPTQQANLQRLMDALDDLYGPKEPEGGLEDMLVRWLEETFDGTLESPASTARAPTASPAGQASPSAEGAPTSIAGNDSVPDMGAPGFSLADQVYRQEQERAHRKRLQELEVAQRLVELQQDRQTIIRLINDERYRQKFGGAYDLYRGTRDLIVPVIQKGGEWLKWIEDPEAAAMAAVQAWEKEQLSNGVNQALREEGVLYGPEAEIMTMEDVAIKAYEFIEHASTVPSLIHYGYYREVYQKSIDEGDSPADAHNWALTKLREMMQDPTDEYMQADLLRFTRAWNASASHNEELFQVYDKAFERLNSRSVDPGVSR